MRNHTPSTVADISRARAMQRGHARRLQMEGIWDAIGSAVNGAITASGKDAKGNVSIGASLGGAAAAAAIGLGGALIEGAFKGSGSPPPQYQQQQPPQLDPPPPPPPPPAPVPTVVRRPSALASRAPVTTSRTMSAPGPYASPSQSGMSTTTIAIGAAAALGLGFLAFKKGWI